MYITAKKNFKGNIWKIDKKFEASKEFMGNLSLLFCNKRGLEIFLNRNLLACIQEDPSSLSLF